MSMTLVISAPTMIPISMAMPKRRVRGQRARKSEMQMDPAGLASRVTKLSSGVKSQGSAS